MFGTTVGVRAGARALGTAVGARAFRIRRHALVLLAAVSWTEAAAARPEYPGVLQKALAMEGCVPVCTVCHTDPAGGADRLNGFFPQPYSVVLAALAKMPLPALDGDFDGDTMSDGDELKAGRSPILSGDAGICAPQYGCGARIAPLRRDGAGGTGPLLAVGLVLSVRLLRRRRSSLRR